MIRRTVTPQPASDAASSPPFESRVSPVVSSLPTASRTAVVMGRISGSSARAQRAGGSLAGYDVVVGAVSVSHSAPALRSWMYAIMYSCPMSTG